MNFDKIAAVLDRVPDSMDNLEAKIGWFPSAQYPDGTPVASVAATQEFGDPLQHIPARPFLRPTVNRDKDGWVDQLGKGVKEVLAGELDGHDVLDAIAAVGAQGVQKTISEIYTPALAPLTIELRQERGNTSTKPLVDTGHLLATVQGVVGESE